MQPGQFWACEDFENGVAHVVTDMDTYFEALNDKEGKYICSITDCDDLSSQEMACIMDSGNQNGIEKDPLQIPRRRYRHPPGESLAAAGGRQ